MLAAGRGSRTGGLMPQGTASATSQRLVIYGVPFSQPVRAVIWLLLYKQRPFELELINPGSKSERGSRNPDYLAMNPAGTIPALHEPDTGFTLGESNAIMTYLCNQHGWTDVYPDEVRRRAKVDWYLHFHHRSIRPAAIIIAPRVRKDLDIPDVVLAENERALHRGLKTLNSGWLTESRYLTGDTVTIADFAAYAEIGQLQAGFTNCVDLSPYPNIERWIGAMKQVDAHDDVHVVLSELGDISQEAPTMEALKASNKSALRALKAKLQSFGEG